MNYLQDQLKRFFSDRPEFENASYIGRACYVPLGEGLRLKAEFFNQGYADHYSALRLEVINNEQTADITVLRFSDYWNREKHNYIWDYYGKMSWYHGDPTNAEIKSVVDDVCEYISIYSQQNQGMDMSQ